MFVVLEGNAEVRTDIGEPTERLLVTYSAGEFVGELSLLTGQRLFATGRMSTDGRVLRIPVEALRVVMAQEAELSELHPARVLAAAQRADLVRQRPDPGRLALRPRHPPAAPGAVAQPALVALARSRDRRPRPSS